MVVLFFPSRWRHRVNYLITSFVVQGQVDCWFIISEDLFSCCCCKYVCPAPRPYLIPSHCYCYPAYTVRSMWFFGCMRPFSRSMLSAWASWISCELQQHGTHAQNPPLESYTNLSNGTWPCCHLSFSSNIYIIWLIFVFNGSVCSYKSVPIWSAKMHFVDRLHTSLYLSSN